MGEVAKNNESAEEEEVRVPLHGSALKHNMDLIIQEDYFGEGAFVPYQKALWDLFEKPQGGTAAKVTSLLTRLD